MYNATLINLTPDARTIVHQAHVDRNGLGPDELRELLRNFQEVDPIENAVVEAEIRVQVKGESYLIRTEQRKLILYDVHRRELAGQILDLEQVMVELDGTAAAARQQAIQLARAEAEPGEAGPAANPAAAPTMTSSRRRLVVLGCAAGLLLAAILGLRASWADEGAPAGFVPVESSEISPLQAALTGVYLTGNEPGQHGIVFDGEGGLKLFELGAVDAPRVVHVTGVLGRVDTRLCLLTDQPGGLMQIPDNDTLIYCGETYQRIP